MRGISLTEFRKNLSFIKDYTKVKLSSTHQFLIKVHYSPINPSDLGFIGGAYGREQAIKKLQYPLIQGFEGNGVIEDTFDESKNH